MYEQFQNVMKMGPLGKVMSMIPGMSQMMTKGAEHESQVGLGEGERGQGDGESGGARARVGWSREKWSDFEGRCDS